MAISQVSIINGALIALGSDPITSIDEGTIEARTAKARFDYVRDEVLRAHSWNCALAQAELAQLSETPLFGFAYKYALPTNPYCLKVVKLSEEDAGYLWRVSGRYLETDAETASIDYIQRLTNYGEYDPDLAEAISARLAAEIAYKITANKTMTEAMWELYKLKIAEALGTNAIEGKEEAPAESAWTDARS
jgi:hypothetical protein